MEQRTIQTQESAERIDALLARSLPGLTRSAAQRLLAQGAPSFVTAYSLDDILVEFSDF